MKDVCKENNKIDKFLINNFYNELKKRDLPDALVFNDGTPVTNIKEWQIRRKEIKKILCECEYGFFPNNHLDVISKNTYTDNDYCGGKAIYLQEEITLQSDEKSFSFPINIAIPKNNKPSPAFIYLDFYREFPNKNLPVEEICDHNFAVISFCYKDITSDDANFLDGLCKIFPGQKGTYGKILIWAWATMHVMDYITKIDKIDSNNIAIVGHSRLGKTALLVGAMDERFKYVISNNSGQSGAALSRKKDGENIKDIYSVFPYWFCNNYARYMESEDKQPFDQHYLTSLIAPRNLYVASASEDYWADPKSEFLCCIATNPVYELLGKKGLIYNEKYLSISQEYHEGNIGYHIRKGTHYLSRYDWNQFMKYIELKIDDEE